MSNRHQVPAFFSSRKIECEALPDHILEKAQFIIERIESGEHWSSLKGKRLIWNRSSISIPVGPDYRIMAEETGETIKFKKVVSHSTYNKLIGRR